MNEQEFESPVEADSETNAESAPVLVDESAPEAVEVKSEPHWRKVLRNVVRWSLSLLAAFLLGAVVVFLGMYFPYQRTLKANTADLESAQQKISDQERSLDVFEAENQALTGELQEAKLRLALHTTLSEVRAASLSAGSNDFAGAQLSLSRAAASLDALSRSLAGQHRDVVAAMLESLESAQTEIKTDLTSALPDLERLMINLMRLEQALFPAQ